MATMFDSMFSGAFQKPAPGMLRLSYNGKIAVKVPGQSNVYMTYDPVKNRLVNCSNFVFDANTDEMFFTIPTNKVKCGDIIIVKGLPRCVISTDKNTITAFNYASGNIETFPPEHHVFLGNTYLYGKIFSPFVKMVNDGKQGGASNMLRIGMQMSMMQSMFGGKTVTNFGDTSNFNPMMYMMMFGGGNNLFDGMFDGLTDSDEFDFSNMLDMDDVPHKKKKVKKTPVIVDEDDDDDDEDDEMEDED